MLPRARLLALSLLPVALCGCRQPTAPPVEAPTDSDCFASVAEQFGAQRFLPVAIRPMASPDVFTPELLASIDEVTRALEDARTDHTLAVRSLTTLPLMTPGALGARMETIRDQLPIDVPTAALDRALLMGLDSVRGDTADPAGSAAFVQLPADDFAGVDLDALVDTLALQHAEQLMLAVDGTPGASARIYAEVAGLGPGARAVWVVVGAEDDERLQTPELLRTLEAYQLRVRALPAVAGAHSVVDDLKLTRRAVHKGEPGAAVLPTRLAEVKQLLALWGMSGQGAAFGERLSPDRRATVVRFALGAREDIDAHAVAQRIERFALEGLPGDLDVRVCLD